MNGDSSVYKGILSDEALMTDLIQGLMDILVVIDRDAKIQFVNRAGEELLGYPAAELVGKPAGLIVSDHDLHFLKAVRQLMTTGESRKRDLYLVTRSGEKIPAAFNGSVLRDAERKIQAVVGVIRDMRDIRRLVGELEAAKSGLEEKVRIRTAELTEAKVQIEKAYEDLRIGRDYLKNIIASVPMGMLVLSGDLRVLSANLSFRKMLGKPEINLKGLSYEDVFPGTGLQERLTEVLADGLPQHDIELEQGKKLCRIRITPVSPSREDKARLLLMIEDITEQKRAERILRDTLQTAQDGAIVSNEKGEIIWINPAAERMFGVGDGKLIGRPIACLMPERYRKRHDEAIQRFLKAGSSALFGKPLRLEGLRSNGAEFPLEIVISGFKCDENWILTAFIRDKTEEVMAEDALRKAYEGLTQAQAQLVQSEKMASIGQLAAGVAHEINNPVGFVKSNLWTLKDYTEDLLQLIGGYETFLSAVESGGEGVAAEAKRVRELSKRIDTGFLLSDLSRLVAESFEGVERVQEIVRNLKEFSHIDQGERKPFNLNEGLESTLKIVHNELKYKAEVVKELGELPEIHCHPQQLNQVFMNLLVNAAQAMTGRGNIHVRSFARDGFVVVEVQDTGSGIPPENLKKIFDPFFTTKPVGKGTGLGLSISYGIVKKHGGRIEVESEVGRGTTFRVLLPAASEDDHVG